MILKNDYKIVGDKVILFVNNKGETLEAIISIDKLELVKSFKNTWYASKCSTRHGYYVTGHITIDGKPKNLLLHRFIMDVKESDVEVDHYDNNPLNNTNENLRLVSREQNLQNRTIQSNNTSGYRGVSFHKRKNKWQASVKENGGKQKYLGIFETAEEANEAVVKWRKDNYPFSKEANEVIV